MEIRLLAYSRLSTPSTTPAHAQACIATRSSLILPPPMSIQNLRTSDVADGRGTPARPGGCIEPASNLFLAFVFREHSCSSPPAFPSTGLASKSFFNTPPRATKSRSRTPMGSVVGSPVQSSTANLYPKALYACPYTMTVQAIGYARYSVNSEARPLLYRTPVWRPTVGSRLCQKGRRAGEGYGAGSTLSGGAADVGALLWNAGPLKQTRANAAKPARISSLDGSTKQSRRCDLVAPGVARSCRSMSSRGSRRSRMAWLMSAASGVCGEIAEADNTGE